MWILNVYSLPKGVTESNWDVSESRKISTAGVSCPLLGRLFAATIGDA